MHGSPALGHEIDEKGPEAREAIARINVVLDDVKREIVKATETPNSDSQQGSELAGRVFED